MQRSIKSVSRQYRKACRSVGIAFPKRGAFHIVSNGKTLSPDAIKPGVQAVIFHGPAPVIVNTPDPIKPDPTEGAPILPSLNLPPLFRRTEKVSETTGKKTVRYTAVKNPKSGETYWVKPEGSRNYVKTTLDALLAA